MNLIAASPPTPTTTGLRRTRQLEPTQRGKVAPRNRAPPVSKGCWIALRSLPSPDCTDGETEARCRSNLAKVTLNTGTGAQMRHLPPRAVRAAAQVARARLTGRPASPEPPHSPPAAVRRPPELPGAAALAHLATSMREPRPEIPAPRPAAAPTQCPKRGPSR